MNKSKRPVVLGIDTSCYTTSLALLCLESDDVSMAKRILSVASGKQGLRQSEMVFAHTKNLPELTKQLDFAAVQIMAIGVSIRPRAQEDSYMPAFLTGKGFAISLAQILQVPLFELSHQENHMYAGLFSSKMPACSRFIFVHISGGTTEVIKVDAGVHTLLSGTKDISAGQFIDRIGVRLDLSFPAGPALEQLASTGEHNLELPVAVQKGHISFAGPCSAAMRALDNSSVQAADLAVAVQDCVAVSLFRSIRYFAKEHRLNQVLVVGGVACNQYIKKYLQDNLLKIHIQAYFAEPEYSADNALGCAVFARNSYHVRENILNK